MKFALKCVFKCMVLVHHDVLYTESDLFGINCLKIKLAETTFVVLVQLMRFKITNVVTYEYQGSTYDPSGLSFSLSNMPISDNTAKRAFCSILRQLV